MSHSRQRRRKRRLKDRSAREAYQKEIWIQRKEYLLDLRRDLARAG